MKTIIALIEMVLLTGCGGISTANISMLLHSEADLRSQYVSTNQLSRAMDQKVCSVIRPYTEQRAEVYVGDGLPAKDVIDKLQLRWGNLIPECSLLVIQSDQIIRRPDWHRSRERFDTTMIKAGDVVLIGGIR